MTRRQIESKYGVHISDDSYYSPLRLRFVKAYRIYAADGCQWENGLRTLKDVERECKRWEADLLSIKMNSKR